MIKSVLCCFALAIIFITGCKDGGTPPAIRFREVKRDVAISMIRHYADSTVPHTLNNIIRSITLTNSDIRSLVTKNVVTLKFLTAADLRTDSVTILIQQKIVNGKDSSYVYFDMKQENVLIGNSLCPPPENCEETIEQ